MADAAFKSSILHAFEEEEISACLLVVFSSLSQLLLWFGCRDGLCYCGSVVLSGTSPPGGILRLKTN